LAELFFTDLIVPSEHLVGEENRGFEYLTSNLAQERLSIGINSQAAAATAVDDTAVSSSGCSRCRGLTATVGTR
jgi:acyl-CoA dehydrogenase